MNNTALGAENKKEQIINFISEAHEKFYYEKLEIIERNEFQNLFDKSKKLIDSARSNMG